LKKVFQDSTQKICLAVIFLTLTRLHSMLPFFSKSKALCCFAVNSIYEPSLLQASDYNKLFKLKQTEGGSWAGSISKLLNPRNKSIGEERKIENC
jgi:hypothetical protein